MPIPDKYEVSSRLYVLETVLATLLVDMRDTRKSDRVLSLAVEAWSRAGNVAALSRDEFRQQAAEFSLTAEAVKEYLDERGVDLGDLDD